MTDTPPDRVDLMAALDKFGDDAKFWDDNGDVLSKAKQDAEGIDIDPLAFGPAVWLGLSDKYNEVQQMIVDRLEEGGKEFGAIADSLITARDAYKREEEQGVHALKKFW